VPSASFAGGPRCPISSLICFNVSVNVAVPARRRRPVHVPAIASDAGRMGTMRMTGMTEDGDDGDDGTPGRRGGGLVAAGE
jgi:hypothetical protein